ncbi:MAG: hypothetical protein ACI976_001473, partial [Aureispira sp.]
KFIRVHPFDDGNGRLARILMNMLLMRAGYPPSVIKAAEKEAYYTALRKADGDDLNAFVEYVGTVLLDSMDLYLRGAKGESIEDLDDVDKEFELLKRMVDGEQDNLTLTKKTTSSILRNIIFPLYETILGKLFKCNDFYRGNKFFFKKKEGKYFINDYAELTKLLANSVVDDGIRQKSSIDLSLDWNSFTKTSGSISKFDYSLYLRLFFEDTYCRLILFDSNEVAHTLDEFHYHKNPEQKATEIANKLLKDFMNHIKKNLEK